MSPSYVPPRPPMQPFAIALEQPGISIGSDRTQIGWRGVGPAEVPILARGDGIVIFDFPSAARFAGPAVPGYHPQGGSPIPRSVVTAEKERTEIAYARIQYMNAWLAAYMSAMSTIEKFGIITPAPADPHNHLKAEIEGGLWVAYPVDSPAKVGPAYLTPVSPELFDHILELLQAAEKRLGSNFSTTLALFHQSSYQYRMHQFASAHLTAWTITEQVISIIWRDYQSSVSSGPQATTNMSKARRDILNGRDFTASVITQVLSLARKVSDEQLSKLDRARRDRNNFAHSLVPISGEAAQNALQIASEMLSGVIGVRIAPQLSNSYWI